MSSRVPSANPDIAPDQVLADIASYAATYEPTSREAYETARHCLLDAVGCGLLALSYPECTKHLGPFVPGTVVPLGVRVPGTSYVLDPVKGAFDIGCLVRWLDYNDTWLAAEWGHPSDNLGAILAVADYVAQRGHPVTMRDVLTAMIKAYEIQGVLALQNSFNRVGLDHVLLVRIASTAVATQMLGGSVDEIRNAVSQAWIDGGALRAYRHSPNTGSRKSWAAGDATSRAVRLAMISLKGEMGYPTALSTKVWGFYDVLFKSHAFSLPRPFGSYVMEHILFKVSFPAEFHAQTAVEAAIQLYPQVRNRWDEIERIEIGTHESAMRIIDKRGPLHNPADRDHCLQYMIAIGLLHGDLTAEDYEDEAAADPRIDELRAKMMVHENPQYTRDYLDPEKRSIANDLTVFFKQGPPTEMVAVEYPIGHRRRRAEAVPLILDKFTRNLETRYSAKQVAAIKRLTLAEDFEQLPVTQFMSAFVL